MILAPRVRLGAFEVLARLGAGGMGEVYRARDTRLDREVALKVLPADTMADGVARARLLREARLASRLNHPNVCTIHEVGEAEGQVFIAMELVEGASLAAHLAKGALPVEQVLRLGAQIAGALAHAHDRGVVHRDLKSANIVITAEGSAKVLDFGLAKGLPAFESGDATKGSLATLTEPGTIAGTLAYMPPEQLRGEKVDARSDVWALGVVLHEMVAGSRPFQGSTAFSLSSAILNEPPAALPPATPANVAATIARCLEKQPGQRYQSAADVRASLVAMAAAGDAATTRRLELVSPRRRWLLAAGLVSALSATLLMLDVGGARSRLGRMRVAVPLDSIAVLPFENLSGDPEQAYLAAGFHEALITHLAQRGGLRRVIARASVAPYERSKKPLGQVARELDVKVLMTGSVLRSGNRVRVTAHLIDPGTDEQLWSDSFERDLRDLLSMQDDIVGAITQKTRLRLSPKDGAPLAPPRPVNAESFEAYLKGRFHLNALTPDGFEKGLGFMREAIARDPTSPLPHAGLALGYALIGHEAMPDAFDRAKAAAGAAAELGGTLAETEEALGEIALYSDWDWAGAERAFERALSLNPSLPGAHGHYAWYLELAGRRDEAYAEMRRAMDVDPLTPIWGVWLGGMYRYAGRYQEAIAAVEKSLQLNPSFPVGLRVLGDVYAQMGRFPDALAQHQRAVRASPALRWALAHTYALAGRSDAARAIAADLAKKPTPMDMWGLAKTFTALGDHEEALRWLEACHSARFSWVPWIGHDPAFAPLRHEPRFLDLLRRLRLPHGAPGLAGLA